MAKRAIAIAAVALIVGAAAGYAFGSSGGGSSGPLSPGGSPSPSPVHLVKVGGVFMNERRDELTPEMEPYPFTTPIPPRVPTAIDGTYLRIMAIDDVGGPIVGLPYRCLRCIPYRVDPGLTALIFYEGRYFLHHHLSGFKARGHYTVDGDRLLLFNDPNCSSTPGTYRWRLDGRSLSFRVVDDPCAFDDERSGDLMVRAWTQVPACHRRLIGLWPGFLGC